MIDRNLIAKKLANIETYVQELRDLGHPAEIGDDLRERRFFERTLQVTIQSMIDIASNILSSARPGEPEARGLVDPLEQGGWVQADLAAQLRIWVRLRNSLVYDYENIDPELIERIATEHLDDFLVFVRAIRQQLMPS
jgi:uncharacterized protein YutE (UPF0331/DUF86 family)